MTNIAHILSEHKKWLSGEGGARADLRYADLSGANLYGADLSGAYLRGADLSGADLSEANLRGADLSGANLYGADLSGAYLRGADLSGADLSGADLSEANLRGADLSGADLSEANLRGANLSGAYGNGSPDMTCVQLHWAVCMTRDTMAIGCQQHNVADWWSFTDYEINKMDSEALAWWSVHKPILRSLWDAKWGDVKEVSHD